MAVGIAEISKFFEQVYHKGYVPADPQYGPIYDWRTYEMEPHPLGGSARWKSPRMDVGETCELCAWVRTEGMKPRHWCYV